MSGTLHQINYEKILIIDSGTKDTRWAATAPLREKANCGDTADNHIRICRRHTLEPFWQVRARVTTSTGGCIHTEPKHAMHERVHVRVINGVHEVRSGRPFDVLLGNFSAVQREFSKEMVVAYEFQEPITLVILPK